MEVIVMPEPQSITKIEAARRQLATAIELWFHDKDQVSIYALSFAAYEVIHFVSKRKGRTRDLIFDSLILKKEYENNFFRLVRGTANFFKHADRDPNPEGVLLFQPLFSEMFIAFSIAGIGSMGMKANEYESAFMAWLMITRPNLLTVTGKRFFSEQIPVDAPDKLRNLHKSEFLNIALQVRRNPS
jgi:hypothetical protein